MSRSLIMFAIVIAARIAIADPTPDPAQLYQLGQTAFNQRRFDDAIAAWEQSYAISHLPALTYNIAQAYRLRGHPGDCATARTDYQYFVESAPPSPERDLAQRYITELATCASTARPTTAPPPTSTTSATTLLPTAPPGSTAEVPSHDEHPLRRRTVGLVALGLAGGGILVAGIALGHHAATLAADVTSACSVSCEWSVEKTKDAAGHRDAGLGAAFDVVGAVALVGGVALYYFGVHERGVTVAPTARGPGAVLNWSASW